MLAFGASANHMGAMSRTKIKICGLSTPETVDAALAARASHIGLVFFARSPRNVTPEAARALSRQARGAAVPVGVFVDPDDALVGAAVAAGIDVVQLHGSETPERASAIRRTFGVEVWKAIPIRTAYDLAGAAAFRGAADRLLFDAKPPPGSDLPGGMGLRFDWRLLEGFRHPLPWALSGGLDAGNVTEAVRRTSATLVDVSSGIESAPGVKDKGRVLAFLKAVQSL